MHHYGNIINQKVINDSITHTLTSKHAHTVTYVARTHTHTHTHKHLLCHTYGVTTTRPLAGHQSAAWSSLEMWMWWNEVIQLVRAHFLPLRGQVVHVHRHHEVTFNETSITSISGVHRHNFHNSSPAKCDCF